MVLLQPGMLPFKEKRAYTLQRDYCVLEREKRVTKILGSHAFREELEGILQGQLDGSRNPPKLSRALNNLQEHVAPASAVETARRGPGAPAGASSVIPINDLRGARSSRYVLHERQLRCKLASLCRLVDWFKWSQLVDNHVSARGGVGEGREFLVNPFGLLYSEVTASSLVRVSGEDGGAIVHGGSTKLGANRAGVELHSAIYGARRDVQCIMHLHTVAGAAVSVMSCGLLPISEEALSVGKVSYYEGRKPLAGHKEKKEFAKALGKNKVLILRNHGLVAVGNCVEECFHVMYNLVQACKIQVAAVSAGLPNLTQLLPPTLGSGAQEGNVGAAVASVWRTKAHMEFEALMRMLDNQGYQTGYKYRGLSLLEDGGDCSRGAAWEEVVERGERDGRLHQRRKDLKGKGQHETWEFLDDNRSRDKPLTKNTKISVRVGQARGGVSPLEEEEGTESGGDPWQFLTSRESSVRSPDSKAGSRPSTAQRLTNTSGGSGTANDVDPTSHSHPRSSISGRRRGRRKKKSNSASSQQTPPGAGANLAHPYHSTTHSVTSADEGTTTPTLPPPDLSTLEQTAERVAHSTGIAVQKLSQKRMMAEGEKERGRTDSDPNLTSTWENHSLRELHYVQRPVDSQGYSSGDEASYLGSPRRPVQTYGTSERISTLPLTKTLHPPPHSPPHPLTLSDDTSTSPHTSHTSPPTHTPADISYPAGLSSAEKAAHVARLVADSTGSAVQKLSETMAERQQHVSLTGTTDLTTTLTHTAEI